MLPISEYIWDAKYRWRDAGIPREQTIEETWRRVAQALARPESDASLWEQRFYELLDEFKFLPGGRILAGAGTGHKVTLFNCFVMGNIQDSMDGIFDALKEGALTMQQGGGVGYDFSTLRPRGSIARATGTVASGPVSFMNIWNAMGGTLLSTGARRGAMMATLRCDHPDILEFIGAKSTQDSLRHFNLSVLVSDDFMHAVQQDTLWHLVFPLAPGETWERATVVRQWSGQRAPVTCGIVDTLPARSVWQALLSAAYEGAEPGVLFIDRINQFNNLHYAEQISATNPCGEIPLPAYGVCDLGSINLCAFVRQPFAGNADFDLPGLAQAVHVAVRLMDNVIDVSGYPLPQQQAAQQERRRVGIGITGLADALIMLGRRYDSESGRQAAVAVMRTLCHEAYRASVNLAKEKGSFPLFDRDRYLAGTFIRNLPDDILRGIHDHGIRNSHLVAIAPTGTVSLLANNVSSGLEPVFARSYERYIKRVDGGSESYQIESRAAHLWAKKYPGRELTEQFVFAHDISPHDHLAMQAVLQPFVDNAISKTINLPEDFPFEDFCAIFTEAYANGLKGCTVYRPNSLRGAVLETTVDSPGPCCTIDRETD